MADAVAVVHARAAERRRVDLLAERVAHDARPGQEHRRVLGHQDQVGERGRVRAAAGRRARHDRDLRHDAGQRDGLAEDPSVAGERRRALLHPGAARLDERRRPGSVARAGRLEHPHDRVGVALAERAAEEAAVLRVARDRPAVDSAGAADDAVARGRARSQPGRDHARAEHLDAARVAQRLEPLERTAPARRLACERGAHDRHPAARARRCDRRRRTSSRWRPAVRR